MSGLVLCVGALSLDTIAWFDTLPALPGKHLPDHFVEVTEGMATAQAATIVRLGGKARLWASIGDDAPGQRMLAELSAEGVDCSAVRRVTRARSGFATIFVDRQGERMVVPFYDPRLAAGPEMAPSMEDVSVVSVDVRWPAAAAAALEAARKRGIPGVLDVERAGDETLQTLLPLATHIIASEAGARQVTGGPMDPADAIAAIAARARGEPFIAITAGDRGVDWAGGHIPAFPVKAVDTLAAGDVFHGAFAFGLSEGWDSERSLRFAAAAAAIKCTRPGGRLGAPSRIEVEQLLQSGSRPPLREGERCG